MTGKLSRLIFRLRRWSPVNREDIKSFIYGFYMPVAIFRARQAARDKQRVPRLAVFVCSEPAVRQAKLAWGLRSAGWKVVLIYRKKPDWALESYFDEARQFRSGWEALAIAGGYRPAVYHAFPELYAGKLAYIFARHKPGKLVFDIWDIIYYEWPEFSEQLFHPSILRYCLEHSDGFCSRDFRLKYAARSLQVRPPRVIFFPDYCWDTGQEEGRDRDGDNEMHVVLVGSFGLEKFGRSFDGYLDIAEKLTSQGIHFHIYLHPHWWWLSEQEFKEVFSDYLALARHTPFFHLHESMPMDSLVKEISGYDIGIFINRALIYEDVSPHIKEVLGHFCPTRIADYMDAGLPVISNKELRLAFFALRRYGAAVDATKEMMNNARRYLEPLLSPGVRERIKKGRADYSIKKQIGRLITFYESL
jgi:hypothetical protein